MKSYNTNENNFDRILLFKPQGDWTYIRKLSMSYGYYTALAIVNKQNMVTHVGANNNFQILPFNKLNHYHKSLLGKEKCKKLRDDDIMSVYKITSPLKLWHDFKLLKPCRGMRYSISEETVSLKKEILKTLSHNYNVSLVDAKNLEEYKTLSDNNIPVEFKELLVNIDDGDYTSFNQLNVFTSDKAKGQTRLI